MSSRRRVGFAAAFLVLTSCATTEPFQPADESALVTLETLAEYGLELPEGYAYHEKWSRERLVGTLMIEYEFQNPAGGPPFVHSSAEIYPTPDNACLAFKAGNVGIKISSLELIDRNDLFSYGEKSRFAVIDNGGKPVGNVFTMCRSRSVLLVMFVGLYFDDAEAWRSLIEPRLEALEALEAANPPE